VFTEPNCCVYIIVTNAILLVKSYCLRAYVQMRLPPEVRRMTLFW